MSVEGAARVVRVFVSSPSDVAPERGRVQAVAAKLNREYEDLVRFETVLWEEHFYKADRSFQPQIDRIGQPDACDVLVSIFWTRVGTELPADFARMPNGRPYPSGTAYELLTALEASKNNGIPDVYVFRKTADAALPTADAERRRQAQTQLDALEAFWSEWFKSEQGHFKAAFQTFPSTDEFERQIEELLRQWLHSNRLLGPRLQWPKEKGSPFPGLAAFEADQAAVFFGRDRAIDEARRRLVGAAEAGTPFLLIVGASGSGKSSLARAGLIPRLTTPGVVETVDLWRVVLMKPGEGQDGPVSALAGALFAALPELAGGDFPDQAALADNLRRGGAAAARPVANALARIVETERKERNADQPVRARLVLLIDQSEELFAQAINDDERAAFAQAVKELVAIGKVWCVATLRADLYELLLKQPVLNALKDDGARVDLGPPGAAELAEIVRAPAAAAGLSFETTGEKGALDERLLEDAKSADSLPLLQFALRHLYETRVETDGETRLTHAAYDALGGLQGAIAAEAERAVAMVPPGALDALPRLLRRLAEPARDGKSFTLREAERADVAEESGEAALVAALLGARILIAGTNAAARPTLRLAHDAVLTAWPRAADAAQESRDFYRVRAEVEDAERRWREHGQPKDRLIQRGVPLAEAEKLAADFADELPPEFIAYVNTSRRQARLRQRLVAGAAVFFFVLAVAATGAGVWAFREQRHAQTALADATEAANSLVFNLAQQFRDKPGVPIALIKDILDRAQALQHQLTAQAGLTPELEWSEAASLTELIPVLIRVGDPPDAVKAGAAARDLSRSLLAADPQNREYQVAMAVAYERYGDALLTQGRYKDVIESYRAEVSVLEKLAAAEPNNTDVKERLAFGYSKLAHAQALGGDSAASATSINIYMKSLAMLQSLLSSQPQNPEKTRWLDDIAGIHAEIAEALASQNKDDDALKEFQKAIRIFEQLRSAKKLDITEQVKAALLYGRIAVILFKQGKHDEAIDTYKKELPIIEPLAKSDPENLYVQFAVEHACDQLAGMYKQISQPAEAIRLYKQSAAIAKQFADANAMAGVGLNWKDEYAQMMNSIGELEALQGKFDDALASFRASLTAREQLAAFDPANKAFQREYWQTYAIIGSALTKKGDLPGALDAFRNALAITKKLIAADPSDSDTLHGMGVLYTAIGAVRAVQGDHADALKAYAESVSFRKKLAESDPSNAELQSDLAQSYKALGDLQEQQSDLAGALKSYRGALEVRQKLAKSEPASTGRQSDLATAYGDVGDVQVAQGNFTGALASYQAAAGIMTALTAADPEKSEWQLDLARLYVKVADANVKQNKPQAVLSAYQAEAAIMARLAKSAPDNKDWQRELALAYGRIGALQKVQGKLADALRFFQRSLAIFQKLAASDPDNAAWQHAQAIMNQEIGAVQMAQQDLPAALGSFQASAASAEHLAATHHDNAGLQHELGTAYDRVGDVQEQQGKLADALTTFRRSLAIRQALVAVDPKNADWRADIQTSVQKIGALAYYLLLGRDFATALQAADQAISLAPAQIWLYTNRAHALMFLTRSNEARALYLKYRDQKNVDDGKPWPAVILDDFAALRKAGLSNPLMDEIEKDFKASG